MRESRDRGLIEIYRIASMFSIVRQFDASPQGTTSGRRFQRNVVRNQSAFFSRDSCDIEGSC
jgi:hypothetical protein